MLVHFHMGRPCPSGLLHPLQYNISQPFTAAGKGRWCAQQKFKRGQQVIAQAQLATAVKDTTRVTGEMYLLNGNQGSKVSAWCQQQLFFYARTLGIVHSQGLSHHAGVNHS